MASSGLGRNLTFLVMALTAVSLNTAAQPAPPKAQAYFTEPAISPDGSEIACVSGGDIWIAPAGGGEARLLVSNPANESRPLAVTAEMDVDFAREKLEVVQQA